jgi:hypothetical protein
MLSNAATATFHFGDDGTCIGELLGGQREGMKIMFKMNESRLNTGAQGIEAASAAYEHAVQYDVKITAIYEGTNGIQAMDFVGRKFGQRKGANVANLFTMIGEGIARLASSGGLEPYVQRLEESSGALSGLIAHFARVGGSDPSSRCSAPPPPWK